MTALLVVLLAVVLPVYWGIQTARRAAAARSAAPDRLPEEPVEVAASAVELVEVPIETVPSHVRPDRPTLYVAR